MIPLLTPGASLWSLAGEFSFLGHPISGHTTQYLSVVMPSAKFIRSAFGDAFDIAELLNSHTFLRLVTNFEDVLDTDACSPARRLSLRYAHIRSRWPRRCPLCIRSDVEQRGYSHWRLVHEIESVKHCVVHDVGLEWCCSNCRQPYARLLSPPHSPCRRCGTTTGLALPVPASSSYRKYSEQICRCVASCDPSFRAEQRASNIHRANRVGVGNDQLIADFLHYWKAENLSQLSETAGTPISRVALCHLLRGRRNHASIPELAMISIYARERALQYAQDELKAALRPDEQLENSSALSDHQILQLDPLYRWLHCRAQQFGISHEAAQLLAKGYRVSTLHSKYAPLSNLVRLMETLPDALQHVYQCRRSWPVRPQMSDRLSVELYRWRLRRRALLLKERYSIGSRTELKHRIGQKCEKWMRDHDHEWLDANIPHKQRLRCSPPLGRPPSSSKERIEATRAAFLAYRPCNRAELFKQFSHVDVAWMLRHDAKWMERNFPARVGRSPQNELIHSSKLKLAASRLKAEGTALCRHDLARELGTGQVEWLRLHEPKWIDLHFPVMTKSTGAPFSKGSSRRRSALRKKVLRLVTDNPGIGLASVAKAIGSKDLTWLRSFDRRWLWEHIFPSGTSEDVTGVGLTI